MILTGDCLELMATLAPDSVDAIVTDPPYHLTNPGGGGPHGKGLETPYARARAGAASTGFMGKEWDGGDIAFRPETWAAALRVAKPGAYLAAFGGTRTFHRMMCAIEDGGWELRDTLMWVYGSGFPKSKNLTGDREGWGTALKPAWEPIVLARRRLALPNVAANVAEHGTGALNIDGCRVEAVDDRGPITGRGGMPARHREDQPREAGVVAQPHELGRWPANLVHDGSEDVLAAFPSAPGQQGDLTAKEPSRPAVNAYGDMKAPREFKARRDGEASASRRYAEDASDFALLPGLRRHPTSAARFFYCAKASPEDRGKGNHHPTVKPTDLMRWLCRLVTPPGGLVLDPFTGSGSTGRGAIAEGFRFQGIERDPEYAAIAADRVRETQPGLSFAR